MTETDPLTQLHDAIWVMLEDDAAFCQLVQRQNRVKYPVTSRLAAKDSVQSADLPEVWVVPVRAVPHVDNTSGSSRLLVTWEIRVTTGDQRPQTTLLPLTWILFRALANWKTRLRALTWGGNTFVVSCVPSGVTFGEVDLELERGVSGWVALWVVETDILVSSTALRGV